MECVHGTNYMHLTVLSSESADYSVSLFRRVILSNNIMEITFSQQEDAYVWFPSTTCVGLDTNKLPV